MKFYKTTKFRVLACLTAALLLGCVFGAVSDDAVTPLSKFCSVVFAPLQKAANDIKLSFVVPDLSDEEKDNYIAELESKVSNYESMLVDYENLRSELASYELFEKVLTENPDYEACYAEIVARDTASLYSAFTINKGSLDGVAVNNPVVYGDKNLIGIVREVSEKSSVVLTVTDPAVSLGVYEIRSREDGYLQNNVETGFSAKTAMAGLDDSTAISEGGIVCTSGVGGICPRDLIVGNVVSVSQGKDGTAYALIAPSVDVSSITSVFVITAFEGQAK